MAANGWPCRPEGFNLKTHNKMVIAVGALALTATTVLAGCGGSSTASTPAAEPAAASSPAAEPAAASSPAAEPAAASSPAAEPAAASSPAAEVTTSVIDGVVKPTDVPDDVWVKFKEGPGIAALDDGLVDATPEKLSEVCAMDLDTLKTTVFAIDEKKLGAQWAAEYGSGSAEEWSAVFAQFVDNFQRISCAKSQ
jgi:hypothetical protein